MTDRPILFSGPMVRAILDGRKTQTRRVLKPQPFPVGGPFYQPHPVMSPRERHSVSLQWFIANFQNVPWAVGDRLWVCEAYRVHHRFDHVKPSEIQAIEGDVFYQANDPVIPVHLGKLRPSLFMPRWASRLTLTVTDVRVQRVQEMSEDDAWAEGCKPGDPDDNGNPFPAEEPHPVGGFVGWECARDWFADLWDSLNEPRGYGWEANPWVVAITFDVRRCNIDGKEKDK